MDEQTQNISKKELYDMNKSAKKKTAEVTDKKKLKKRIILWSGVALVLLGSVWGLMKLSEGTPDNGNNTPIITTAVSEDDIVLGNKDSKVILVEYSDFQCPACKAYQPLVKQLLKEKGDKFLFVYRHFPLPQHLQAKPASYAAEAAGKQGKFWEMHDMIFEKQTDWAGKKDADEIFTQYAKNLGLDMARFESDSASSAIRDKVANQYKSGIANSVNATPTFFLNGKKILPKSYEDLVKMIDEANG